MAENDTAPSPVTLVAYNLLRQGLGVEEVSRRTGLPLALVELIAAEQSSRPGSGAVGPGCDSPWWRRDWVITTGIAALAVTSLITALTSATLHTTTVVVTSVGCTGVSLLAVHLYTRPRR